MKPSLKQSFVLASAILVLALVGACVQTETRQVGNEGFVLLKVSPSSAEVYVDGELVGKASEFDGGPSGKLRLSGGLHKIELRKEGYRPYVKEVYVGSGAVQTLRATLRESQ